MQAGDDETNQPPQATGEILLAAPPSGWARVGGTQSESLQLAEYIP